MAEQAQPFHSSQISSHSLSIPQQGQRYHCFQGYASQAGICPLQPAVLRVSFCFVTKARPTLGDPMDWGLPGFSVHEIFQARVLEWVAVSFPWGSSQPRERTCVSRISCLGTRILYHQGSPTQRLGTVFSAVALAAVDAPRALAFLKTHP